MEVKFVFVLLFGVQFLSNVYGMAGKMEQLAMLI